MGRGVEDDRDAGEREATVCNSSPLIALTQIGRLDLLPQLFTDVFVPHAVAEETAASVGRPSWLVVRDLRQAPPPGLAAARIAAGERDAIALAIEIATPSVVLDDKRARCHAAGLGLRSVGTLGVLALAKDRGMLPLLAPEIEHLVRHRFFVAPEVVAQILRRAGE